MGTAPLAFYRGNERGLFAADVCAGAKPHARFKRKVAAENIFAQVTLCARRIDRKLNARRRQRVFRTYVEITDAGTGRITREYKTFEHAVRISLPKFSVRSPLRLDESLIRLGIREAFTPAADLSGISRERMQVTTIMHEAKIDVAEAGTEAAAATAVLPEPAAADTRRSHFFASMTFCWSVVNFILYITSPITIT